MACQRERDGGCSCRKDDKTLDGYPHRRTMSRRTARPFAWSLFTLGLGLWLAGGVFAWLTRDLSAQTSWAGSNLIVSFAFGATLLTYPLAGLLIGLRRPRTPIGWSLLGIG